MNQYFLTDKNKEAIPYHSGQQIIFMTNQGYSFAINVNEKKSSMVPYHWGVESCEYDEIETIETTLFSTHPELNIIITISALNDYDEIEFLNLEISINNKFFYPDCEMRPFIQKDFHDTTVNNQFYENAMIFELCPDYMEKNDSTAIYFDKIVYSKDNGIELITFTNNDYYELEKP
jgi:hypothetical protein